MQGFEKEMIMEKAFDYNEAVARLEEIAMKVEDPSTSLDDIDRLVRESEKLVESCRGYLRSVREKVESIDGNS